MQFVKPVPFDEAIGKVGVKTTIGSKLNSTEWSAVPVALRERAFFSSTVESAKFLQRAKDAIGDFLTGSRETLANGQTVLKNGSRQEFVKLLSAFAAGEGMGPLTPDQAGTLQDITSQKRLGLIFDTQTRQAQDFGYWKQGMDADVLDEFPAQRFIRVQSVKEPRTDHARFEGEVRLKSDLDFWIRINEDFGVPWGPWGWGCGHDVEDVDRAEAEKLGLIGPDDTLAGGPQVEKDFNDRLEASVAGLDEDMQRFLKESFGEQVEIADGKAAWNLTQGRKGAETQRREEEAPQQQRPTEAEAGRNATGATRTEGVRQAVINAGLGNRRATAEDMQRLREELKESAPVKARDAIGTVVGARRGLVKKPTIEKLTQEFLEFIPPETVARLPKLNMLAGAMSDNGSYGNGGRVRLNRQITTEAELRRVTFHELMHWVHREGSAEYKQRIKEHFDARTAGEKVAPLEGYGRSIRGKRDKWYEAYAGRVYDFEPEGGEGLEVPTRYIEWLTQSPEKMAALWNDPDFRETLMIVLEGLF